MTEDYPPDPGGVATSAQRIARNLARLGHKILLLTFDSSRAVTEPDYTVRQMDEAVEVCRLGPFFHRQPGLSMGEDTRAIYRRRMLDAMEPVARAFQPQLVFSFSAENAAFLGTFLSRSLEVPHVIGVRGADVGQYMFSLKHLPGLQMTMGSAAHVICVNEHLKRRLLLGFPHLAGRSSVVRNSVELAIPSRPQRSRTYLGAKTNWPRQAVVAVFIGAPREKKGADILVQALARSRQAVDLRLLIVGSDFRKEDRERCGELIDRLNAADAIHVTGNLGRQAALEIAAEGDIVVMPSLDDGLPNGLLEGMALGLCPIVSDLFQDLVADGSTGWVVKRNDPEHLAAAFISAVESPEERSRFGAAAQAYIAANHLPAIEAGAYVRVFTEIAGGESHPVGSSHPPLQPAMAGRAT